MREMVAQRKERIEMRRLRGSVKMANVHLRFSAWAVLAALFSLSAHAIAGDSSTAVSPSEKCVSVGAANCLALVTRAVLGEKKLDSISSLEFAEIGHTQVAEQSYRQEPFLNSYERLNELVDLKGKRMYRETKMTWPESDPGPAESSAVVVVGPDGGVRRSKGADQPCASSDIEAARDALTLGPISVLLAASQASDVHFEEQEMLRSTPHLTIGFTTGGQRVRLVVNRSNLLPDAVETISQLHDFWFYWGDVERKIYFDNWKIFHGLRYPSTAIEERNGLVWRSRQVLDLQVNPAIDESQFAMDPAAKQLSLTARGKDAPFHAGKTVELAAGVMLFSGSWNATIIRQDDGVVLLECPLSNQFVRGLLDEARRQNPGAPIKAVVSTSDSWPHVGGIREAVAQGIPVYVLDLNRPLLERMVKASHTLDPDPLSRTPREAQWRQVDRKTYIGSGPNRIELYPIGGASTERQYMVYLPEHKLLYASDTLALHDDGGLYDPELTYEVFEAVERERLDVETVYSMHQGPLQWSAVLNLLRAAFPSMDDRTAAAPAGPRGR